LSDYPPNQVEGNIMNVGPYEANRLIALVRAFHGESGHAVSGDQVEAIRQLCVDPTFGRAWMLAVGDRDVGYALAYYRHSIDYGGRIAVLDDLWVTVNRRGHGLGARLLEAVCEDLRALGARAVLLEVDPANKVAISLYSRFGFAHTGTAFYVKGLVVF
jgi:GNAT superfamily N-acetyltransferase